MTNASTKRKIRVITEQDLLKDGELSQAEQKRQIEQDLRRISREEGCERAATIVQQGMARGLSTRDAPHSAKSMYDHRRHEKTSNKADARQARLEREANRKAARAKRAAPKADDERKITIVDKKFSFGREGSARNASWLACKKSKTVAEYADKGGALKYLPRWVSAGAIKLG